MVEVVDRCSSLNKAGRNDARDADVHLSCTLVHTALTRPASSSRVPTMPGQTQFTQTPAAA